MDENSPDGCYGLRCKDCELFTPKTLDNEECRRRRALALKKLVEEELDDIGEWDEGWD